MSKPDFLIWVVPPTSPEGNAQVILRSSEDEVPLSTLIFATQYLMHIVAQKHPDGYEKTLEMLMSGAMTWQHLGVVEQKEE